ncbi:GPW/gp25 family protein [Pseudomonas sp. PS02288]|uniref:GPW/gp25 family protein n=1 Tax=Pseudomonas sp. PS02288 TaxID=2991443 RepID=UPI002499D6F8|nr:GPW/gp25 family protein [Pseudomonas sp. PS02288]
MSGLNLSTGRAISGLAHLRQSIADILTTPIGSRLQRRTYGSQLPELIDAPFNNATRLLAYAATAMALMRWEPRIRLNKVAFTLGDDAGTWYLDIICTPVDSNESQNLQIPLAMGAA